MSISILAKVKEFAEFWRNQLNRLYEIGDARKKACLPPEGFGFYQEVRQCYVISLEFEYDIELESFREFTQSIKANAEYIPIDMKTTYYELSLEIVQLWNYHLTKLKSLKYWVNCERVTFSQIENITDSAYDYFLVRFDELAGAIRVMQSCNGLKEMLKQEAEEENKHFRNLNYHVRQEQEYKKGINRIIEYCDSEQKHSNDGYIEQLTGDVVAIAEETLETVKNMPFDEPENTLFAEP